MLTGINQCFEDCKERLLLAGVDSFRYRNPFGNVVYIIYKIQGQYYKLICFVTLLLLLSESHNILNIYQAFTILLYTISICSRETQKTSQ
jgi:hypothetical protein